MNQCCSRKSYKGPFCNLDVYGVEGTYVALWKHRLKNVVKLIQESATIWDTFGT